MSKVFTFPLGAITVILPSTLFERFFIICPTLKSPLVKSVEVSTSLVSVGKLPKLLCLFPPLIYKSIICIYLMLFIVSKAKSILTV